MSMCQRVRLELAEKAQGEELSHSWKARPDYPPTAHIRRLGMAFPLWILEAAAR